MNLFTYLSLSKLNWIESIVLIKEKLSRHGYKKAVDRINEAQMVLGTPGEMYLEVMNELLNLQQDSAEEFRLIEDEVRKLLDYGRSIGYFNRNI